MSDLQHLLSKINHIATSYAPEKYALDVRILVRNFHEQFDPGTEEDEPTQSEARWFSDSAPSPGEHKTCSC
jgi:hypothetical protein